MSIVEAVKRLFRGKPKPPRELKYLSYAEADTLIGSDPSWRLAPEEDTNRSIGYVYLERRVK